MKIEIFKNNDFGAVRILKDEKGEPWFVLSDVCKILDIKNVSDVKNSLDIDDIDTIEVIDNIGRKQKANAINESGLYQVIFQSRKSEAKQFKRWVTSEVLPTIRKHGMYATDEVIDEIISNPEFGIKLLTQLKEEKEARKKAEEKVTILTHTNKLYTATEIAKELGFRSATAFNKQLAKDKIQFKVNGTWVLCSDYSNMGLTSIKQDILDNGKIIYDRKWTGIGREFLIEKYLKKDTE